MPTIFSETENLFEISLLVVAELLVILLFTRLTLAMVSLIVKRLSTVVKTTAMAKRVKKTERFIRLMTLLFGVFSAIAVVSFNVWMIFTGKNPFDYTISLLYSIESQTWQNISLAMLKVLVVIGIARFLNRMIFRAIRVVEQKSLKNSQDKNHLILTKFYNGLAQLLHNVMWMLVIIFAVQQFNVPESIESNLFKLVSIYLTIGLCFLAARTIAVVVGIFDSFSQRSAEKKGWQDYYKVLSSLLPLFERSLVVIIFIATTALVLTQLDVLPRVVTFGPRVIQAIGIFFVATLCIKTGYLVIDGNKKDSADIDEVEQRRRATVVPLMKTIFTYFCYFVALVLILASLGLDVMPFLAGAGVLSIVLGLGAQSFINDLLNGFFILFENTYLVGDIIDTGGVLGTVVQIDFRTTRIRDPDGNLHTIRNGEITRSKNYCKDFTYAVVEVRAGYDTEVTLINELLEKSGQDIKTAMPEWVTGDIAILGIVEFEPSAMRFRTTTPVSPGRHFSVATKLREIIKLNFDAANVRMPPLHQHITMKSEA